MAISRASVWNSWSSCNLFLRRLRRCFSKVSWLEEGMVFRSCMACVMVCSCSSLEGGVGGLWRRGVVVLCGVVIFGR